MVHPGERRSSAIQGSVKRRTFNMTFPGFDGDIKILADIAAIDSKRITQDEERALDLYATVKHLRKNMRFKTGELVFAEEEEKEEAEGAQEED